MGAAAGCFRLGFGLKFAAMSATQNPTDAAEGGAFDFAELISPLGPDAFFQEYWERRPLLLQQRGSAYYEPLLSIRDLEDFISQGDARYPAIRLATGGAFFAPEAYTRDVKYGDEVFRGMPDVEKIFTEYSMGATVTLPALHLALPALGRLCAQLQAQLDHSVHTNAYLTPPGATGFTPHYDTHEVFVLQIAGSKRWRVYEPPLQLPHRNQPFSPESYTLPAAPLMQFELQAGDLLYLPRGHVHTTTTGQSFSAHVTIGITVYTWVELLAEFIHRGIEQPQLRAALPPGFAHRPELRPELEKRLGELLQTLDRSTSIETLTEQFLRRARAAQPRAAVRFRADPEQISAGTRLQVVPGQPLRLEREHGELRLLVAGRRIRLQNATGPALEAIGRGGVFTALTLPDTIGVDARLALLRYLHGLGLLQRIDTPA